MLILSFTANAADARRLYLATGRRGADVRLSLDEAKSERLRRQIAKMGADASGTIVKAGAAGSTDAALFGGALTLPLARAPGENVDLIAVAIAEMERIAR